MASDMLQSSDCGTCRKHEAERESFSDEAFGAQGLLALSTSPTVTALKQPIRGKSFDTYFSVDKSIDSYAVSSSHSIRSSRTAENCPTSVDTESTRSRIASVFTGKYVIFAPWYIPETVEVSFLA